MGIRLLASETDEQRRETPGTGDRRPYGFSDEVYRRADAKLSLSRMTFSHQIVRAIFAEQIYRAFTILNNEPYHHE